MAFNCDVTVLRDAVRWSVMRSGAVPRNDHVDAWTVKGVIMKTFGCFLLIAVMTFAAYSFSLASDSNTACFDIATEGGNITHIFVDSGIGASASAFTITVDGQPVVKLHTEDGPCESIPRDVWFSLESSQETAHVCVSVQGEGEADIQVYAKVDNECIIGSTPLVSIEPVE
jgi:hypothetical protein